MDPILTLPYSRLDMIDLPAFRGNGIPRHLYLIEEVLAGEGFMHRTRAPAVSFVLNGPIEANGRIGYAALNRLWWLLNLAYRSDALVRGLAGWLAAADRVLKRRGLGFSSSVCLFAKVLSAGVAADPGRQGTVPGA
jgi:hypothetical protein